jgi:hypothetical protein
LSFSVPPLPTATQFTATRLYKIAKRILCVEIEGEWPAKEITGFLSRLHLKPISADRAVEVDYTLRVSCDKPPHVPPQPETFEVQRGICHTDWQSYYLFIDESLILVRAPPSKQAEVWIGESSHARHPVALANVMSYAMQAAMRRIGLFELHAAGVVEPTKGVGALIIGNSNCGKSALTIRLAHDGWGYLSDDMLLLDENRGKIVARGVRRIFTISPHIVEGWKLPRLKDALGGPIPSDPDKRHLDPGIVFPNSFVESTVPKVLLFPSITGDSRTRLERLSQGRAMMNLVTACAWARYDKTVAREYLQVLANLARQSVSWALYAGHDMLEETGCAAALLGEHMT